MRGYRLVLLMLAAFLCVVLVVFRVYERQLSRLWFGLVANPELELVLTEAAEAHREMARLDPEGANAARERFERSQAMRRHLRIVGHNREALIGQFETVVWSAFALVLLAAVAIHTWQRRQTGLRLAALRRPLVALAEGDMPPTATDHRKDAIGMVSRMIEETATLFTQQRARLRQLEQVNMWREAARRHAHELRSPLTALHSEVDRLASEHGARSDIQLSLAAIRDELRTLQRFVEAFTAFGRLPKPRPVVIDVRTLAKRIVHRYGEVWSHLQVELSGCEELWVLGDEDLLARVLVNLADNADRAIGQTGQATPGHLKLLCQRMEDMAYVHVMDDGPGIADSLRQRLFTPYVTTQPVGEGMGLGLAIARAIVLDHGGNLQLAPSTRGAHFILELPAVQKESKP